MRVLISACRANMSVQQNETRLHSMAGDLVRQGLQFEVAVGYYPEAGQEVSSEVTYVVHLRTEGHSMDAIDAIAQEWANYGAKYDQECVGIVFDGDFYLAYPNAPLEFVGLFKEQPEQPKGKPCTFYRGKWYMAEAHNG